MRKLKQTGQRHAEEPFERADSIMEETFSRRASVWVGREELGGVNV